MFSYENQKPSNEYTVYFGSAPGRISMYSDGIVIRNGKRDTPVRSNYVEQVTRLAGDALLGKVSVELSYFDMFGNREAVEVRMRENDYRALKKDLGK